MKRCAIYTRKSSEEGLEQEFNSLHAQREACEAYIKSQRHEGWEILSEIYDDGGISGGTLERPALKRLLEDIREGKVDIVVVYKVDRLTRSLADFAKIVELFDSKQVSFVSVTQQFNTTSSMGRLTLNVLLSFAQFEREVTGERIRDKVAASKKKGMWMGGMVPLGYDAVDKKLVINRTEAETVQNIFNRYLGLGCVRLLQEELAQQGIRSKERPTSTKFGKSILSRGTLYNLLSNSIYIGQIRHKDTYYTGQHEAIISHDLWKNVQQTLRNNGLKPSRPNRTTEASLLLGKLFDETGVALTPSHAVKQGKRYRYYISKHFTSGNAKGNKPGWRLPAKEIENAIIQTIQRMLENTLALTEALQKQPLDPFYIPQILSNAATASKKLSFPQHQHALVSQILHQANLHTGHLELVISLKPLCPEGMDLDEMLYMYHTMPIKIKRRGTEVRLAIEGRNSQKIDKTLIKAVARAHAWHTEWMAGETIIAIAKREKLPKTYVRSVMKLAFLAPNFIEDIITGNQNIELTTDELIKSSDFSIEWNLQKKA